MNSDIENLKIDSLIKKAEVIEQEFNNQIFIIVIREGVADMENVCCLSNTSYDIWKLIKNRISIKKIINHFIKIYDIDYKIAESDILEFLQKALNEGIITKI